MEPDQRLTRIDAEINAFRRRWLLAYDAGASRSWFESLIDEALDRRLILTGGRVTN